MINLIDKDHYKIEDEKLVIDANPRIEIPILQILYVKFSEDLKDPYVTIETAAGITTILRIDPKQKAKLKILINNQRAKLFSKNK